MTVGDSGLAGLDLRILSSQELGSFTVSFSSSTHASIKKEKKKERVKHYSTAYCDFSGPYSSLQPTTAPHDINIEWCQYGVGLLNKKSG